MIEGELVKSARHLYEFILSSLARAAPALLWHDATLTLRDAHYQMILGPLSSLIVAASRNVFLK